MHDDYKRIECAEDATLAQLNEHTTSPANRRSERTDMTAEHVERLMKRCQIGVGGRNALDDAHEIVAECYGTLGVQQARIAELEAELDRMRSNYENACKLVAQMHYETPGSHIGPRLGVVQDVAALRAERDALKVERDEWAAKWHAMRRQYGEMR